MQSPATPLPPSGDRNAPASRTGLADRLAGFLLLKEVSDNVAARREADGIAFDFGDQAFRKIVMVLLMAHAAIVADELDAVALDVVDRADRSAVGADDLHVLADLFNCRHSIASFVLDSLNASRRIMDARGSRVQGLGRRSLVRVDRRLLPDPGDELVELDRLLGRRQRGGFSKSVVTGGFSNAAGGSG